ncbi:MAG: SPOR domain-containing protein [Gammaproteobacteria bacterium]|nr:SPOR domain-containing protein [Gammaproteobacteria bacterium]
MRWLFYALLAANALTGFWFFLERQGAPVPALVGHGRLPTIPLLREIAVREQPVSATKVEPKLAEAPAVRAYAPTTDPLAAVSDAPNPDSPAKPAVPDAVPEASSTTASTGNPVEAAKATIPAVMPESNAPQTTQLEAPKEVAAVAGPMQVGPRPSPLTEPVPARVPTEPVAPPQMERCWRSAVLAETDASARLELALRSQGWVTRRVAEPVSGTNDYIVYWPRFPDRARALAKMRELRSQGVDSFVIGEGEWRNGLSLGLFSRRENAKRHAEELRRRGLQAAVGPRSREPERLRFEVRLPAGADLSAVGTEFAAKFAKITCD